MLTRVLVPLDGSKRSEDALPWAVRLARMRNLTLTLCRVIGYPYAAPVPFAGAFVGSVLYDDIVRQEHEAAEAYLNAVRQHLGNVPVPVETVVRPGAAADTILDLADEVGAYAIAMSTRGHGGVGRFLLGSVAEQVLRQAAVPVLIVPPRCVPPDVATVGRVLVPLDGSPLAEGAVDVARELGIPGSRVKLVQVVPLHPYHERRLWPDFSGQHVPTGPDVPVGAVVDACAYLGRVAASFGGDAGEIATSVLRVESPGEVSDCLVSVATREMVDLIVMSSHGRTGPARWRLGSVADDVIRHADRPILVVSGRAVAARAAGQLTVGEAMTREVMAVRDDESVGIVIRKLARRGASGAPVVDATGRVVGVVSERDLLAWEERVLDGLDPDSGVSPAEYIRQVTGRQVGSLMSQPPKTIDAAASLHHASTLFRESGVRRLPVTRDQRLVGILTQGDLLRALASRIEAASAAVGAERPETTVTGIGQTPPA